MSKLEKVGELCQVDQTPDKVAGLLANAASPLAKAAAGTCRRRRHHISRGLFPEGSREWAKPCALHCWSRSWPKLMSLYAAQGRRGVW
jgi:hypothetical protein